MFYKTFGEYHLKRTERKEKMNLFFYGIAIFTIGLGIILLFLFI